MLLNCGVGEDSWESLDCKEIHPVHPKGDQSCVFIGRTDVEAETPILWPPDAKSWLIGKDPDAGKDWGQEEKGMAEDEMWMASPTQWTWVWVDSRSWWWTGRPGMLRFMGSQRVGHNWATELNWTDSHGLSIAFLWVVEKTPSTAFFWFFFCLVTGHFFLVLFFLFPTCFLVSIPILSPESHKIFSLKNFLGVLGKNLRTCLWTLSQKTWSKSRSYFKLESRQLWCRSPQPIFWEQYFSFSCSHLMNYQWLCNTWIHFQLHCFSIFYFFHFRILESKAKTN